MITKRAASVDDALTLTKGQAFMLRMKEELPALGRNAVSQESVGSGELSKDDEKKEC
jgi:hypothetical protein